MEKSDVVIAWLLKFNLIFNLSTNEKSLYEENFSSGSSNSI
jgi:hypothetical protein